eukprot:gene15229-30564_t
MPNWCYNSLTVTTTGTNDDATTTIADQLEAFRVGNASESGDEVLSFQRAVPI